VAVLLHAGLLFEKAPSVATAGRSVVLAHASGGVILLNTGPFRMAVLAMPVRIDLGEAKAPVCCVGVAALSRVY